MLFRSEALRPHATTIAGGGFAWSSTRFDLSQSGVRDDAQGAFASGAVFNVLGLTARAGRLFDERDDARGGPAVAVISDVLWRQRFGRAPGAIGSVLHVNRQPFTIIGVLPASFFGMDVGSRADVVLPIASRLVLDGADHPLDARST